MASKSDLGTVISIVLDFFILLAAIFPMDFSQTFDLSIGNFRLALLVVGIAGLFAIFYFGLGHPRQKYKQGKVDSFDASLDKTEYRLGENMICHIKFKGTIENGFFDAILHLPDGQYIYRWDHSTMAEDTSANTPGTLNLDKREFETSWPVHLQNDWPAGGYTVQLAVYDHHLVGGRLREFAFYVVNKLGNLHFLVPRQTVWHRNRVAQKEFRISVLPMVGK